MLSTDLAVSSIANESELGKEIVDYARKLIRKGYRIDI